MSYVLGLTAPCLVGCSVCFMVLSTGMFSKQLPPRSVELQEVLVCSFLNRLRPYSDLPLLRPPEKAPQAKKLIHSSACCACQDVASTGPCNLPSIKSIHRQLFLPI